MKHFLVIVLLATLLLNPAYGEKWGKLIQFGTGIYTNSIRRTSNGGAIVEISQTNVIKLNQFGEIEWQKVGLNHAIETPDHGFAGIGLRNQQWFLAKFDSSQNLQWQRTYNFETSGNVNFIWLRAVGVSGYILAGIEFNRNAPRKCLLIRTDAKGNVLWMKRYPGFNLLDMETVKNTSFILVGRPNVTVMQVSAAGKLLFKGMFGTGYEEPASIQPTLDGNFVVASNRRTNPIQSFITKFSISSTGAKILWRQSFRGQPRPIFFSVRSTREGFLVSGRRRAKNEPNSDMMLMQLNSNGIFQWDNYFGGRGSEYGFAVATTDNHFIIAGSTNSTATNNEAVFALKFLRKENAGNFCSFFKSYEEPITQALIDPPPPIVVRSQSVENASATAEDASFEISDTELQFEDLCGN